MISAIKSIYKGRRAIQKLVKVKFTGKRIPVRVSLLVTKFCNLSCSFCYVEELNSKKVADPSLEGIKNILDQIYDAGCRWVSFIGGEPLIRNDIEDIIDYARSKKMFIEMTTNGFYVKKRIEALKKVDFLTISLDGDEESNNKSRGDGSFEKIVEGIEYALKNDIKVRVHAVLSKRTMSKKSLEFLSDFCNRLKVKLNFSEISLDDDKREPDFDLSDNELMEFYRSYKRLKKNGLPIVSSDVAIKYMEKWPLPEQTTIYKKDLPEIPKDSYYPCKLGRNQVFISVEGNVNPCPQLWSHGKNMHEVGFAEAWKHLEDLDCVSCKVLGCTEQSVMTGLEPKTMVNAITNFASS